MKHIHFTILTLLLVVPVMIFGTPKDSTYSVKNRWVVKASASAYRSFDYNLAVLSVGPDYEGLVHPQKMNYRLEASYAFCKNFEIGVLVGLQAYEYYNNTDIPEQLILTKTVAPTFGLNLNFQILPIFVHSNQCRWDLYLRAGYEGCVLPKFEIENMGYRYPEEKKYRQTYGVGLGLAYYFKNRIGLFGELSVGNYSLFPKYTESNVNFRFGIASKFNYK